MHNRHWVFHEEGHYHLLLTPRENTQENEFKGKITVYLTTNVQLRKLWKND